jgi:cardiolipin synthase (CMP-forming)
MLARRHIPNALTVARLVAVPLCLAIMLANPNGKAIALLGIFVAAAITDFLDGFLARRWQVTSPLGALLDPIADKLLVALMLVYLLMQRGAANPLTLAANGAPLFLPVVVIILRELYISGLREFLANRQITLPVSAGGKWKTALQMLAITLLLLAPVLSVPAPIYCGVAPFVAAFSDACTAAQQWALMYVAPLGLGLLYASALLAVTSAITYTRRSWSQLR